MDITTLAAWGEFIGGIAVVVSLVYLAGQIRQNSRLQRASTTALIANNGIAANAFLTSDPELSLIFREGIGDLRSLSKPDRYRFDSLMGTIIAAADNLFVGQVSIGALHPSRLGGLSDRDQSVISHYSPRSALSAISGSASNRSPKFLIRCGGVDRS
jgi:hypothetical protein